MNISDKNCKIYLKATQEWVSVTKDFYKVYSRDIYNHRRCEQRHGRCSLPRGKWWLCDTDCLACEFYCGNGELSIDAKMGDESATLADLELADTVTPESIAIDKALLNALYRELDALDPEGRRICELLSRLSEREAAEVMGMSRSTFKRRWSKVQARLAKRLGDYR